MSQTRGVDDGASSRMLNQRSTARSGRRSAVIQASNRMKYGTAYKPDRLDSSYAGQRRRGVPLMKYMVIAVLLATIVGAVLYAVNHPGEPPKAEKEAGWMQR